MRNPVRNQLASLEHRSLHDVVYATHTFNEITNKLFEIQFFHIMRTPWHRCNGNADNLG